jgi:hypothetical protein
VGRRNKNLSGSRSADKKKRKRERREISFPGRTWLGSKTAVDAPPEGAVAPSADRAPPQRAIKWILFAALVAFLPVPFYVPFWAMAHVPVSYLLFSVKRVGVVGVIFGILAMLIEFAIAAIAAHFIQRASERNIRTTILAALIAALAMMSLSPVYKPGLDPLRPGVNIIKLFKQGIPVGQ